ncbi:MAG: hypothetical protein WDN69_25340 [Aliidongia sp.]
MNAQSGFRARASAISRRQVSAELRCVAVAQKARDAEIEIPAQTALRRRLAGGQRGEQRQPVLAQIGEQRRRRRSSRIDHRNCGEADLPEILQRYDR